MARVCKGRVKAFSCSSILLFVQEEMAAWRDEHQGHMAERRAIMDAYRDLSHQIREAAIAARPLR